MADRIVVGYFGDRRSLSSTVQSAGTCGVVAVAFDLGGHTSLTALRDDALAMGALRCHALDVRDAFAREVILPALRNGAVDARAEINALAGPFVRRTLESIRELEAATAVDAGHLVLPWTTSPSRAGGRGPATIALQVIDGLPVALNDIPMTLPEILESLETISGQPAVDVLRLAYEDLATAQDGRVELGLVDGRVDVLSRLVAS